ncbi:unnamed protein product [Cylindrotheca closterium]|uniref:BRO1 domain-containing protein n=1 Tax=Cylindrotheca closterium TaxID=2856 RepID=A0AAD2G542_9STRA|nr:unnamed protein product [Cylindrotheca closterium]
MNKLQLHQIMEMSNESAALIVQKEYGKGMEKLKTCLGQLQAHLTQMPKLSSGNSGDAHSSSLDTWMYPAVEALHDDDGCGPTSSFFVYRRPLVVPLSNIGTAENLKSSHNCVTGQHTSLLIAMLFNYGLACHLAYIDHGEGRLNDGSRPEYDLLQRASQMYDLAITNRRRLVPSEATAHRNVVSSNIQFFRAAMNNLAICEQTRCGLLAAPRNASGASDIPFNKGFERLRELLLQYPPASNAPAQQTLWNCYMSNILSVIYSFQPNYCAAAC